MCLAFRGIMRLQITQHNQHESFIGERICLFIIYIQKSVLLLLACFKFQKNTIFIMKSVAIPKAIPWYSCMVDQAAAAIQPREDFLTPIFTASFF